MTVSMARPAGGRARTHWNQDAKNPTLPQGAGRSASSRYESSPCLPDAAPKPASSDAPREVFPLSASRTRPPQLTAAIQRVRRWDASSVHGSIRVSHAGIRYPLLAPLLDSPAVESPAVRRRLRPPEPETMSDVWSEFDGSLMEWTRMSRFADGTGEELLLKSIIRYIQAS
jgi:hypothetical protein